MLSAEYVSILLGILMYLHRIDVVVSACKCLSNVAYEIGSSSLNVEAWKWFIAPATGGLDSVVSAFKTNAELSAVLYPLLENFGRKHYPELFFTHLRSVLPSMAEYFAFVTEFLVRSVAWAKRV